MNRPKLAAFPKAYMDALCIDNSMSLQQWIELGAQLGVDGLEFYSGFLALQDSKNWSHYKQLANDHGLSIPMMCCSPDFTHPDPNFRAAEVEKEKSWIEMTAALGGSYCRVLSGQARPEVNREEGIRYTVEAIEACLPLARSHGITLIIENHYKDNYWTYPEFAQMSDVFCELVGRIDDPNFGVNYDPSNTILAGEDPIELLEKIKHRVVTMHASDRYLANGTLEDLRKVENSRGYAALLSHGEIGKGMNDYDQIFSILKEQGFQGWISIEDGVDGFDQLQRSANFLKQKVAEHWS
ncbi:MAG: sugar phosphate isomerase/epimerase [Saprospiraceae bacterium]|nr:sugar phosphate isomerase/epimerase [Saprospiraceae bacterium]